MPVRRLRELLTKRLTTAHKDLTEAARARDVVGSKLLRQDAVEESGNILRSKLVRTRYRRLGWRWSLGLRGQRVHLGLLPGQ